MVSCRDRFKTVLRLCRRRLGPYALLLLAALAVAELPLDRVQQLYGGQAVRIYRDWQQLLLAQRRESNELRACAEFCVNGHLAGNCHLVRSPHVYQETHHFR